MTHEGLEQLAADPRLRERGWDGYRSEPLSDRAIAAARQFFAGLSAVPCGDGGVQIEIHCHQFDLEIEFKPDGSQLALFSLASSSGAGSPQEPKG